MPIQNYTPIEDLLQKYKSSMVGYPKEGEPPLRRPDTQFDEVEEVQGVVEHQVQDEEVAKHVDVKPETIQLTEDLKRHGLQPVSDPQFYDYQKVKLPLTDDKVVTGLHAPLTSSIRWLATLAQFILWQSHIKLKVVGGKVVRVIKRN